MKVYNTPGLSYDDILIAPEYSEIESRSEIDLSTKVTRNVRLRIPLVSAPMDTVTGIDMAVALGRAGGMGFLHRYCTVDEQVDMAQNVYAQTEDGDVFGAAVGVTGDYLERAQELERNGASVILIDVAHADHKLVGDAVDTLKATITEADIMVGNVATQEAAARLVMRGVDGVRVGIGNGSHCTTRLAAGVGVPQASAVDAAVSVCYEQGVPVCADGGILYPGDAAKALGLGASTVMCGSVFAGTLESPGGVNVQGFGPTARRFKEYRGMASHNAKVQDDREANNIEGVATMISYRGEVGPIIEDFLAGIRSGMSYTGASDLGEFYRRCVFVMVTANANHLGKRGGM